jgi:hypothetical protein
MNIGAVTPVDTRRSVALHARSLGPLEKTRALRDDTAGSLQRTLLGNLIAHIAPPKAYSLTECVIPTGAVLQA